MHLEKSETPFWVHILSELADWEYAYLWKSFDDYYFVKKTNDTYVIKKIETIDDDCIRDRMWDNFDTHEERVNEVSNGNTDRGYEDWESDIDIWDYCDSDDYHSCPMAVVNILYDLWLWSSEYSSDNWYYLDECQTFTITSNLLDTLYNKFDRFDNDVNEKIFNEELWADIEKKYGFHQIEFLQAEPIR